MLALAVLTLLAAPVAAFDAQKLEPRTREPITARFVNSPFTTVIAFVGKQAGIEVEIDDSATPERRNTKITVSLENASLEEVLNTLTSLAGLSYMVVNSQTIRIYQQP